MISSQSPRGTWPRLVSTARTRLIYLAYNTIFNRLTQDAQVRCFQKVARHHSEDDGVFLVEAGTPDPLYRLRDHQSVDAESVETDRVTLDVARLTPSRRSSTRTT